MADYDVSKCQQIPDIDFESFKERSEKMAKLLEERLLEQYKAGRIDASTYAQAYVQALNNVFSLALNFTLQEPIVNAQAELYMAQACQIECQIEKCQTEICLIEMQIEALRLQTQVNAGGEITKCEDGFNFTDIKEQIGTWEAERDRVIAQKELYERQRKGFDQDARQKFINSLLQAWQVRFSSDPANADTTPSYIVKCALDKIIERYGKEDVNLIDLVEDGDVQGVMDKDCQS